MSPRLALLAVLAFFALAAGGLTVLLLTLHGQTLRRRASAGAKTLVGPVIPFKWPGDQRKN